MKGKKLSAHHKTKCNIITTISIIIKIIVGFIMIHIIYTSKMYKTTTSFYYYHMEGKVWHR